MTHSRSRRPPRRPRLPRAPFPSLHPGERIRGAGILEENASHGCGLVLWESFRNVGDWVTTPRAARNGAMFGAGAAERRTAHLRCVPPGDGGLCAALEAIRDLLAHPAQADERTVALACRQLSSWAAENARPATQFYFAALAALCVPDDARQAYRAGCLARGMARWDAAEVWLEHAVTVARRRRDREMQTTAVLGLGSMFYQQGFYLRAGEAHSVALAIARRYGMRDKEGMALHDLFVIAVEVGDTAEAERYARDALRAYGPGHRLVAALAHDVAYFWMNQRFFSHALAVLEALLPHFSGSNEQRLRVLANLGRAAGGCGDRNRFEAAWSQVWDQVEKVGARTTVAPALIDIAYGAMELDDRSRVSRAAETALRLARRRGETDVIARAEELVAALGSGAESHQRSGLAPVPEGSAETARLAEQFVVSLAEAVAHA